MDTIKTPDDRYVWAYDMDGKAGPAAESIMHLLGDRLTGDEWSLMVLCATGADRHLTAKPVESGVRLMSTENFENAYEMKVNVLLPHKAFARYLDNGRYHLMFSGARLRRK